MGARQKVVWVAEVVLDGYGNIVLLVVGPHGTAQAKQLATVGIDGQRAALAVGEHHAAGQAVYQRSVTGSLGLLLGFGGGKLLPQNLDFQL